VGDKNFPGRSNAAQTGDRDRHRVHRNRGSALRVPLARWIAPWGLAWWRVGTAYSNTRRSLSLLRRLLLDPLDPGMGMAANNRSAAKPRDAHVALMPAGCESGGLLVGCRAVRSAERCRGCRSSETSIPFSTPFGHNAVELARSIRRSCHIAFWQTPQDDFSTTPLTVSGRTSTVAHRANEPQHQVGQGIAVGKDA
jgi:hypothetical protein